MKHFWSYRTHKVKLTTQSVILIFSAIIEHVREPVISSAHKYM